MWFAALVLALVAPQTPLQVEGLRAGESIEPAGKPSSPWYASEWGDLRGRLLDGTIGAPIAGAEVELWQTYEAGPVRVETGRTDSDGGYLIWRSNDYEGDTLLVRADGYRSALAPSWGTEEILALPRATHLALRAVDLDGVPIHGARAEAHWTDGRGPVPCDASSDAQGRFDLAGLPPLSDGVRILVTARGFGGVWIEQPERLLAAGGLDVRLPKRRPLEFEIVDAHGTPLSSANVVLGVGPGRRVAATDADGRVAIESAPFDRRFLLSIRAGMGSDYLGAGLAPTSFVPRLVFVPRDALTARPRTPEGPGFPVRTVDARGEPLDVPVRALREGGSTRHCFERVGRIPEHWGRVTLVAGGPFTGHGERVVTLEVPAAVTLELAREPVVEIRLPAGERWLVHVQAGADSVTLDGPSLPARQPVPSRRRIVVCAIGSSETRIARVDALEADRTLDMTSADCVVAPAERIPWRPTRRISFAESGYSGEVLTARGRVAVERSATAVEFELGPHEHFEGRIAAEGRVPLYVGSWNPNDPAHGAMTALALPRRASLALRGKVRGALAPGRRWSTSGPEGVTLEGLAPGPLIAVLEDWSGRYYALHLELRDGEQRELTLP